MARLSRDAVILLFLEMVVLQGIHEVEHIVQVFDVGHDPEHGLFMVMELLSGEDLADRLDREFKLRAAAFYADAGLRLRDDRNWADQQRKYQDDMADRKKKIEEAKAQLEDLQERARKSGVPRAAD